MRGGTILSVSSRALLAACARLGLETDAILAAAGLERAVLDDVDARIPAESVTALWQAAHQQAGDPALALHAAEALPAGAYKVIDFVSSSSASIGEGLGRVSRYFPLINDAVELPLHFQGDCVHVRLASRHVVPAGYAEYALAAVYLRSKLGFEMNFPLQGVEFTHSPPPDCSEHQRVFGCEVRFAAPHAQIRIARSTWETPLATANAGLCAVLDEHARNLLAALPQRRGFMADVHEAIHAALRGGDPTPRGVAKRLGMSGRSLQRRLQSEGKTFKQLVDELRAELARVYLKEPDVSVAEIAYLLGYAEASSFTRAFRRWTGTSPVEYRSLA